MVQTCVPIPSSSDWFKPLKGWDKLGTLLSVTRCGWQAAYCTGKWLICSTMSSNVAVLKVINDTMHRTSSSEWSAENGELPPETVLPLNCWISNEFLRCL